jgi:hypothetical protein
MLARKAGLGQSTRVLGLALAAMMGVWALSATAAHASGCTDSWTNSSGGNWTAGSNWSKNAPPTSEDEACISLSGTYKVTLGVAGGADSTSVKALTVGGGATGAQTLDIHGINSTGDTLLTASSVANEPNGAIVLDCQLPCSSGGKVSLQVTSGTLANGGTITTTAPNAAQLLGNLSNTGTVQIQDATAVFSQGSAPAPVTLDNRGTLAIATGALLTTDQTVTNGLAGKIAATGTGTLRSNAIFNEGAGTTTGSTPVTLTSGSTLNFTGTGPSSFLMYQGGGFTLSGNIAKKQTLTVQGQNFTGDTLVSAAAGFVNSGSIRLGCRNPPSSSCAGGLITLAVPGTLNNKGTVETTLPAGAERVIQGNVINAAKLTLAAGQTLAATGTYTQATTGNFTTEIAGESSFGAFSVAGTATIAGTLTVKQVKKYVPAAGKTFAILGSASLTGTFAKVAGNMIANTTLFYRPHYSATGVTLVVEP